MTNIMDRQTFVFSVDLNLVGSAVMQTLMNLRFAADELIVKSISYNVDPANDVAQVV